MLNELLFPPIERPGGSGGGGGGTESGRGVVVGTESE